MACLVISTSSIAAFVHDKSEKSSEIKRTRAKKIGKARLQPILKRTDSEGCLLSKNYRNDGNHSPRSEPTMVCWFGRQHHTNGANYASESQHGPRAKP
ncbi:unnamed protein product [Haemonchus placei]|uniref:Secreted protein n=1 Tax=Haemonchus placei TaxID=6290 RepID=A0A0N4X684_HAEPC|nr:unnamed protein product [Haemonchus placei]